MVHHNGHKPVTRPRPHILELLDKHRGRWHSRNIATAHLSPPIVQRLITRCRAGDTFDRIEGPDVILSATKYWASGHRCRARISRRWEAARKWSNDPAHVVYALFGCAAGRRCASICRARSVRGAWSLRRSEPGQLLCLHCTAIGKVLLAAHDDDRWCLHCWADVRSPASTPATITNLQSLLAYRLAASCAENLAC